MTGDAKAIVDLLQSGGLIGGFVLFFLALYTRRLVFGWMYDQMKQERDEAVAALKDATRNTEKAVEVTDRVVRKGTVR